MIEPPSRAGRVDPLVEAGIDSDAAARLLAAATAPSRLAGPEDRALLVELVGAAVSRTRLTGISIDVAAVPGVHDRVVTVTPSWFDRVWCWGAAVVDGHLVIDTAARSGDGRPGRLVVVQPVAGGIVSVERAVRVDARQRWHLVVF